MTRARIITSFDYPPIPIRCFDWSARRADYDGAPDAGRAGACGHGITEQAAIDDLHEQEAMREEERARA